MPTMGLAQAQDVDVEVRFPNFVSVLLGEDTLSLPPEPKPPERPKPKLIIDKPLSPVTPFFPINPALLNPPSLSDLTKPEASIYEDERGTRVTMHWNSIKHGYRHQILPKPHVQFESYESLRSVLKTLVWVSHSAQSIWDRGASRPMKNA